MNNSNIIISVIIVLCIAAGVTAYSLTNNDSDNVFTDLQGFTPDTDDGGLGDDGINQNTSDMNGNSNSGANVGTNINSGSGSGTGSGTGTGSGSSGYSGNGNGGSSHTGGNGGSGGHSGGDGGNNFISRTQAKNIASGCVAEAGCYVGTPSLSGSTYYCPVFDKSGNKVDVIAVNAKTGAVIGRG